MPDFRDFLSLDYWREHRMTLLYAAAGALLFIIFMIGTFPYDQALTGALMPLGLQISYTGERPAFPVGAVFEDVRLVSLGQPSAAPLMQSDSLKLIPSIGTLFGRPAVGIRADMYGGRVKASVRHSGDITGFHIDLSNIDLSRYPLQATLGVALKGIVSGSAVLEGAGSSMNARSGDVSLEAHRVEIPLFKGLPGIRFELLKTRGRIEGATLRVDSLKGNGPDMTLAGSGIVHLGKTLPQSMIDMTMRITPTIAARARLGVLFAFLPHPPDNRPYTLHGPLLTPLVN